MIVTQETQNSLIELIGKCFVENRYLDRLVSILGTKFAYNNTSNLIHKGIAHYFPLLADEIGEKTLERYNIPVYYPATPSAGQDYSSVEEIIKDMEERMLDFQIAMMGVCKIAQHNDDLHVYGRRCTGCSCWYDHECNVWLVNTGINAYRRSCSTCIYCYRRNVGCNLY